MDGADLGDARNLKEINMDNSKFKRFSRREVEQMSDLNNHPTIFIFHKCGSTMLERVSIRYSNYSQNMLIKFIRNAPTTFKWFRSDLTHEHIKMLTKARPGIQFLN